MNTVTAFDSINRLERRKIYEDYFSPMPITKEQKNKRKEIAEEIDDEWAIFLALFLLALRENQRINAGRAADDHRRRLEEALKKAGVPDDVVKSYLDNVDDPEVDVTEDRYEDGDRWTSPDRALDIALTGANIITHEWEYKNAVESGKTEKQWLTMKDERVRGTHVAVDNQILPIEEPFVVGGYLMMHPGDASLGAGTEELANCRCGIDYF